MGSFQLTIEPWAGSNISDCAQEAVRLATLLDQDVCFDFNEVHCIVKPDSIPEKLVESFHREMQKKSGYRIATGHPDE